MLQADAVFGISRIVIDQLFRGSENLRNTRIKLLFLSEFPKLFIVQPRKSAVPRIPDELVQVDVSYLLIL